MVLIDCDDCGFDFRGMFWTFHLGDSGRIAVRFGSTAVRFAEESTVQELVRRRNEGFARDGSLCRPPRSCFRSHQCCRCRSCRERTRGSCCS